MTERQALKVVLEDEHLEDKVYDVRERAAGDVGWKGDSWDHPRVKAFSDAVVTLQRHARLLRDGHIVSEAPNGCQEASSASVGAYVPCGRPLYALVRNGDTRLYWMCDSCTEHNVLNRGAEIVALASD